MTLSQGTAAVGVSLALVRLVLVAVFAVAGVAKLASLSRTRTAVLDFGAPPALATPLTALLVAGELTAAATLAVTSTAYYGALVALALCSTFAVAIAVNLLGNRRPACNCFGQISSTPIGWTTFARAVILGGLAGFVAAYARDPRAGFVWPALGARDWILATLAALGLLLLAALAALLTQVLRQQGRILLRFDAIEERLGLRTPPAALPSGTGLAPETRAPRFTLPNLRRASRTLDDILSHRRPALLVFTNPRCGPCQRILPDLAQWQQQLGETLTIAVLSEGQTAENEKYAVSLDPDLVLLQKDREVAGAFEVHGTPGALVLTSDGRIATYVAQGAEAIRALVRATVENRVPLLAAPSSPAVGDLIPEFNLKTIGGGRLVSGQVRGQPALMLFWNQQCGFCERMLPDLRTWAAARPAAAPRLLVLSNGSADDHQGWDVKGTLALDAGGRVAGLFGAHGTPMGILIDANGRIASELAAGAHAFFDLARRGLAARGAQPVPASGDRHNGTLV